MTKARIGIIGGTGLYNIKELTDIEEVSLDTPFGKPSAAIILGNLEGIGVAFLPRHGKWHQISPSHLPARANIYALKSLGVDRIISVSAVGSLKETISPRDIVIPDQLIDRTRVRESSFFNNGLVAHIAFAEPFCPELIQILSEAALTADTKVHQGGTYIAIEGPQFSTKAESQLYRSWNADIIGMTALPEAKLAREAEICYATLAIVTDYDCWHETYESVSTEMIISNLGHGITKTSQILRTAISKIPQRRDCICSTALEKAITTPLKHIPAKTKRDLKLIIGKYLSH